MSKDATDIAPRLIADEHLHGRDNSGGPDFDPYCAQFGDGGRVTSPKAYLGVGGGKKDD